MPKLLLLESWKAGHTGFSAHNSVTVRAEDGGGLERLGRYLLRPALSPMSLESLTLEPGLADPGDRDDINDDGGLSPLIIDPWALPE